MIHTHTHTHTHTHGASQPLGGCVTTRFEKINCLFTFSFPPLLYRVPPLQLCLACPGPVFLGKKTLVYYCMQHVCITCTVVLAAHYSACRHACVCHGHPCLSLYTYMALVASRACARVRVCACARVLVRVHKLVLHVYAAPPPPEQKYPPRASTKLLSSSPWPHQRRRL